MPPSMQTVVVPSAATSWAAAAGWRKPAGGQFVGTGERALVLLALVPLILVPLVTLVDLPRLGPLPAGDRQGDLGRPPLERVVDAALEPVGHDDVGSDPDEPDHEQR